MLGFAAQANTLRLATFNTELSRDGPGLLVRDLAKGGVPDIDAALDAIATIAPDILLLLDIDHDLHGIAAKLLRDALQEKGVFYPNMEALRPNSGLRTGLDLNGDGRVGDPQDALGFGEFPGQGGMVLLSQYPLGPVTDYTGTLWRDVDHTQPPTHPDGTPFPSTAAFAVQPLPYVGHWQVPVLINENALATITALHASPPVFDGVEDQNGRRNADELAFAAQHLADKGAVVMGTLNLDPFDSEGRLSAIDALLHHPKLQDPQPSSPLGQTRATQDGGANLRQLGDPALDTADWRDEDGPGNLRVDYVLPAAGFTVLDKGLHWPATGRRALVWTDIALTP